MLAAIDAGKLGLQKCQWAHESVTSPWQNGSKLTRCAQEHRSEGRKRANGDKRMQSESRNRSVTLRRWYFGETAMQAFRPTKRRNRASEVDSAPAGLGLRRRPCGQLNYF